MSYRDTPDPTPKIAASAPAGPMVIRRYLASLSDGPGVYRVEGWLTIDTEERVWIYSNPIYLR